MGRSKEQVVVAEGLEWSSKGEGESGVGGSWGGAAEERQECRGVLGVHSRE